MNSTEKPGRVFSFLVIIIIQVAILSCKQHDPQTESLANFKKVVNRSYQYLASAKINKKAGFFGECSVNMGIESGIRISETVCDDTGDSLNITIRITDPSSRPPSQQLRQITILEQEEDITIARGNTARLLNGITLHFDETGQSVILKGNVSLKP